MKFIIRKVSNYIFYITLAVIGLLAFIILSTKPEYVQGKDIFVYSISNLFMLLGFFFPIILIGFVFGFFGKFKLFKKNHLIEKIIKIILFSIGAFATFTLMSISVENFYSQKVFKIIKEEREIFKENKIKNKKDKEETLQLKKELEQNVELIQKQKEALNRQKEEDKVEVKNLININIKKYENLINDLDALSVENETKEIVDKYSSLIDENKSEIDALLEELNNLNGRIDNLDDIEEIENLVGENSKELDILKLEVMNITTDFKNDKKLKEESERLKEELRKQEEELVKQKKELEKQKELAKEEKSNNSTTNTNKDTIPNTINNFENNNSNKPSNNKNTYYVASGNRYYHKSSTCKFIKGANASATTDVSEKFPCNCAK